MRGYFSVRVGKFECCKIYSGGRAVGARAFSNALFRAIRAPVVCEIFVSQQRVSNELHFGDVEWLAAVISDR